MDASLVPGPRRSGGTTEDRQLTTDKGSAMYVTKLGIDGQVFYLTDETDIDELRRRIVAAARGGAEFVEFEAHGRGHVAVLVTAHLPVRIETVERADEEPSMSAPEMPSFEYDPYSFIN